MAATAPRLSATWTWAPALLAEAEVRALAQGWFAALEALVRHAAQPGAGGRTPSDVPLVSLSQAEIERLEERYPRIEDILPLSPLQEGCCSMRFMMRRDLTSTRFNYARAGRTARCRRSSRQRCRRCWQRHASLRAGFRHENLSRPVQIIVSSLALPWRSIDLSALDAAAQQERLTQILAEDRAERFDLASPPLIRFTLDPAGADRHRLLLTSHHILMDGWSMPVLMRELLALYAQRGDATALPRVTPYREYLAWIAAQDRAPRPRLGAQALAGLEEPTLVAPHGPGAGTGRLGEDRA